MNSENYAVIFDMDGVLVDSLKYVWEAHNQILGRVGVHLGPDEIRKYNGQSLRDQVALWEKEYHVSLGDLEEFRHASNKIQFEQMEKDLKPDQNLLTLLTDLKQKNIPIGVGTSSSKIRAHKALEIAGLKEYFPVIVTADDVTEHKPNPHVFLEVARQLGVVPERCIVIEDALLGIEAARNGKMKAIGFLNAWNTREELEKADKIITSFKEASDIEFRKLFA